MGKKSKQQQQTAASSASAEPEVPEQVVQAFQETQKKVEILQAQLDKLGYRIFQEKKKRDVATLALRFLEDERANPATHKYYIQVGKAFSARPYDRVKQELKTTFEEVEKELPKLLIAQAQFDIKKKEQLDNLQAIARTAKTATAAK